MVCIPFTCDEDGRTNTIGSFIKFSRVHAFCAMSKHGLERNGIVQELLGTSCDVCKLFWESVSVARFDHKISDLFSLTGHRRQFLIIAWSFTNARRTSNWIQREVISSSVCEPCALSLAILPWCRRGSNHWVAKSKLILKTDLYSERSLIARSNVLPFLFFDLSALIFFALYGDEREVILQLMRYLTWRSCPICFFSVALHCMESPFFSHSGVSTSIVHSTIQRLHA